MSDPVISLFPPKLGAALFGVQQELFRMGGVEKDSINPHFGNAYVDRNGVLDAVLPLLNKAGVMVLQGPQPTGLPDSTGLETVLVHVESGERYSFLAVIPLQKSDPQGYGSAMTYGSRYTLVMILGLKTLDDDDGEAGSGRGRPTPAAKKPPGNFPGAPKAQPTAARKGMPSPATKAEAPARPKRALFPTVGVKSAAVDTSDQGGGEDEGEGQEDTRDQD